MELSPNVGQIVGVGGEDIFSRLPLDAISVQFWIVLEIGNGGHGLATDEASVDPDIKTGGIENLRHH